MLIPAPCKILSKWPKLTTAAGTITYVGSNASADANAGTFDITNTMDTGSSVFQRGDLVFLLVATGNDAGTADTHLISRQGGWKLLVREVNTIRMEVWYRMLESFDELGTTRMSACDVTDARFAGYYVVRGVDPWDHFHGVGPTIATGSSTNPDPASITPVSENSLIIVFAASGVNDSTPGGITSYGNQETSSVLDDFPITGTTISRSLAVAAAENPGAFATWSTGAWITATVAVVPARY